MDKKAFTLIEVMIVVAIVGVLAAIAVPQFAQSLRKSREATTKGNLGTLRSALAMYYASTEGAFPQDNLASLTADSMFLRSIPPKDTPPYHPEGNAVGVYADFSGMTAATEDWFYIGNPLNNSYGVVVVNCVHSDLKGQVWSTY